MSGDEESQIRAAREWVAEGKWLSAAQGATLLRHIDALRVSPELWVVGRRHEARPASSAWDFQGVYSSEAAAVERCRNQPDSDLWFVAPCVLDGHVPTELGHEWPGAFYAAVRRPSPEQEDAE